MEKEITLPKVPKLVDNYIKLIQTTKEGNQVSVSKQIDITNDMLNGKKFYLTQNSAFDVYMAYNIKDEFVNWVFQREGQISHKKNLVYKAILNCYEVDSETKYRLRLKNDIATAIGIKPGIIAYNTINKNVGLLSTNYVDKVVTKKSFTNDEIENLIKPKGINLEYFDKVGGYSD